MKMNAFLWFAVAAIWLPMSLSGGYTLRETSTDLDKAFARNGVWFFYRGIDQAVALDFAPDSQTGTSTPLPTPSPTVEPTPTPVVGGPVGENVSLVCGAIVLLLIIIGGVIGVSRRRR
jgi:hypothetical protein